ncbi:nuclear transport factor 2 family protein [Nocardioides sp. REDSEA-S30_B4]|uniref:nuclear transport factor 2 family protein n=1 Tax=Nocardioides sp. REDSEA-S30_B4 TaxID=1811552 RepID=UPI000A40D3D6|nr:nuclear transport factor 2 family protein [Nocardioides sp. REDSEA-S30_B4]
MSTSTDASRPAAITSDAIDWRAATDEHPARMASMRSYSAVAKGDLAEWLTVYAEDAVLEDPVGPSMFDPEGRGHHGHEGIRAFWELAIAPIATFEFTISDSFANAGSNTCANIGSIRTSFPDGSHTTTDLIMVYVVHDDGRVASMKAFWEPERTMATFTKA